MKVQEKGSIIAIHLCPGHRQPMTAVASAMAVEDFGLQGDGHAASGSRRQVLLIDKETLTVLGLVPGVVKENITTRGINLAALAAEQRLRLGASVILEITKPCAPCSRMEEIRPGLQSQLQDRRGLLARVRAGGLIKVGDVIEVEAASADAQAMEEPFAEPVVLPIEDAIDLHTFAPKEIRSVVEEYLNECHRLGISEVRIIHGRGAGVQRQIVRSVLQNHPLVLHFYDAPPEAGGWGATMVRMKDEG
jgi:MOSC domain-containing protein YiiM